jgi:hypothetical protein
MVTRNQVAGCLMFIGALCLLRCASDEVAGIEITNGDCTGKIYNMDNTVAVGAVVRLIPCGYDPLSASGGKIDSTKTNADGTYSFSVTETDFYNVIAEKDSASCIQDSVAVNANRKCTVANDTLEVSGCLAGKLLLQSKNDPREAVILIKGTNIFTMPFDTLGNFIVPPLPAGEFTLMAFTTQVGYGILDTFVTVFAGETTDVMLRLPVAGGPAIDKFSATFSKVTMMVDLQWEPADTALISSYALHRSLKMAGDTVLMFDKNVSAFTDDLVLNGGDTVQYKLAAVGKNYKEGYIAASPPIPVYGNVHMASHDDSCSIPIMYSGYHLAFADSVGNSIWYYRNRVVKLDAHYMMLREYTLPVWGDTGGPVLSKKLGTKNLIYHNNDLSDPVNDSLNLAFRGELHTDNSDRLYLLATNANSSDTRAPVVIITDADLNVLSSFTAVHDTDGVMGNNMRMVVTGGGTIYLLWTCTTGNGQVNRIGVYDHNGKLCKKFTTNNILYDPHCFGDTIVALTYVFSDEYGDVPSAYTINIFDTAFTLKSSFAAINPNRTYCSSVLCDKNSGNYSQVLLMSANLYIATINSVRPSLVFYDFRGNIRGRIGVPSQSWCYFANRHVLYQIGPIITDDGHFIYSTDTAKEFQVNFFVNRYSTTSLF